MDDATRIEELKRKASYFQSRIAESEKMVDETKKELEKLISDNKYLKEKVKFLEGQIEAYQYCMNCRR